MNARQGVTTRVTVWSDDRAGTELGATAATIHPHGVAETLADVTSEQVPDARVLVAGLHERHDGLSEARLEATDVLVLWGHEAHELVRDATVDRIQRHVLEGLGLVVLHSAHHSKIFRRLMGTTCDLRWREAEDEELIWTVAPSHPIAAGVEQPIRLGRHEMYGEHFDIPAPDELIFVSAYTGGEVFRSGCCFRRGAGRIFYFSPGHESHPVYEHPQVRKVIGNGVRWARREGRRPSGAPASAVAAAPAWSHV